MDPPSRSASLARASLVQLGLDQLAPRVVQLIEATATHAADADDAPARSFLDADLSILGADPATYRRYAAGIRREHRGIPAFLFARGRRGFLREALARPSIFLTDHFRGRYERRARENMETELAQLDR